MTLILKERFSLKNKMQIYNEQDEICYEAEAKMISVGRKVHVYDKDGNTLAYIHQKLLSLHGKFFIEIGDTTYELHSPVISFKPHYYVDTVDWEIRGDFLEHNYEIKDKNEETIATVHQGWLHLLDQYAIEVPDQKNELLVLCLVIIADCVEDIKEATAEATVIEEVTRNS